MAVRGAITRAAGWAVGAVLALALSLPPALAQEPDGVAVSAEDWAPLTRQGIAASRDGDAAAAIVWFERALAAAQGFSEDDPRRATAMANLAVQRQQSGSDADVEGLLIEALALRRRSLGAQHARVADAHADLARYYGRSGDLAAADAHWRDALNIREALLGPAARASIAAIDALAAIAAERGDLDQAARWLARATASAHTIGDDAEITQRYRQLAALAVRRAQPVEAEGWLRAGLDALAQRPESDAARVVLLRDLTRLLVHDRRSRAAQRLLETAMVAQPSAPLALQLAAVKVAHGANEAALKLLEDIPAEDAAQRAEAGMIAARAHRQEGRLDAASAAIDEALVQLSVAAGDLGRVPAGLEVELRLERALLMAAEGDRVAALAAIEAALALEQTLWGEASPLLAPTIEAIEHLHVQGGDIAAAAAWRARRQALMR